MFIVRNTWKMLDWIIYSIVIRIKNLIHSITYNLFVWNYFIFNVIFFYTLYRNFIFDIFSGFLGWSDERNAIVRNVSSQSTPHMNRIFLFHNKHQFNCSKTMKPYLKSDAFQIFILDRFFSHETLYSTITVVVIIYKVHLSQNISLSIIYQWFEVLFFLEDGWIHIVSLVIISW